MQFSILQDRNRFIISGGPALDVEFGGQKGQFGSQVFVAVVAAVDVDLLLGSTIGFAIHRPIADLHHPLLATMQGRAGADQIDDVRVIIFPRLHIGGQSEIGMIPVLLHDIGLLGSGQARHRGTSNAQQ